MTHIITITAMHEDTFEQLRADNVMLPRYIRLIDPNGADGDTTGYAYSVDGVGCVFYDTREQMLEDAG